MNPRIKELEPYVLEWARLVDAEMDDLDGVHSEDIFEIMPRLFPQACIELAVLKIIRGKYHILLQYRSANDPHWPNQLGMPGTVLRPRGELSAMLDRLSRETGIRIYWEALQRVGVRVTNHIERGRGPCWHDIRRIITCKREFPHGEFFPLDKLPDGTIEHHLEMINMVRRSLQR